MSLRYVRRRIKYWSHESCCTMHADFCRYTFYRIFSAHFVKTSAQGHSSLGRQIRSSELVYTQTAPQLHCLTGRSETLSDDTGDHTYKMWVYFGFWYSWLSQVFLWPPHFKSMGEIPTTLLPVYSFNRHKCVLARAVPRRGCLYTPSGFWHTCL